ncbi:MAG: rod shape-determining protein MreC [Actinobacteria bacterium]|nr:rod shape-determining protein MreC [Actinomycetota bacterium]
MERNAVPWWLIILVVAAALLLIFQPDSARHVRDSGTQVLAPLSFYAAGISDSVVDAWQTVQSISSLRRTSKEQAEEIDRLSSELVRMRELEQENEDLRRLLGFRQTHPDLRLLPVGILGTEPSGILNAVLIDKGANDGIREDMAIITWKGLAGRVVRVNPTSAGVLLVTDVSSSVAARVQDPNSRASGIVSGRKEGGLIMSHILQQESVQTGDLVITSGVGGGFPEGLALGTVVRVQKRNIEMFQEALLEPAVDPNKLERLYAVLDYPKD